ncbi:MAG TPA: glycoside hydrolase family 3 N-terminal domain-containing protein [Thermoanaerobaculia bacterium]|nr:glycoside hydrolase family 3 N-terminal domain-containing protein [Thermoanaerobaculia bacterium]
MTVIPFLILSFATLSAQTVHPEVWPALPSAVPRDARIEKRVDDLLRKMTLEEKAGQVIQASITRVTPEDIRTYHLGSVLNGGGGFPGAPDGRNAKPKDYLALADAYYAASTDTSDGGQAIPIIWGSDAVHGHSNVVGATVFPHNIGLGATRNYDLIKRIGEITALEMSVTGIQWDFSPVVAVTRDDRWGRTYETYSEDPEIVRAAAAKVLEGLQGAPRTSAFLGRGKVVGCAKHFLGDGGTVEGKDQGNNIATEEQLRDIHAAGYLGALQSGVQTLMISQSSWFGVEMAASRAFLTDILKGRLGFDGILVGDWNVHGQIPGCSNGSCAAALNAGLDMFMVPDDWKALHGNIVAQVKAGEIPMARLDDAVRRILRVKMRAGVFTNVKPSQRPLGGKSEMFGSPAHRAVARQAVRESIVLLKNDGLLPIRPNKNVLVTGDGAHNIPKQAGGWTVTWQGSDTTNEQFPSGTSIWDGIRATVEAAGGRATLSADGTFKEAHDVAIVVFGENPYAEWEGDEKTIVHDNPQTLLTLRRLRASGIPVVSVFLSGRPMWVNPLLNASNAFVAAWLPGSEGNGVADVLFAAPDGAVRHDFRGKLSFSWPKLPTQVVLNHGDAGYDPLFPLGFGLTYNDRVELPRLPVDLTGVDPGRVFFSAAHVEPNELRVDEGIARQDEAGGRLVLAWPGGANREVSINGKPVSLTLETNMGKSLAIDVMVEKRPTRPVWLSVGCGEMCAGDVDITATLNGLALHQWHTIFVPLRCFAANGADMSRVTTPFRVSTVGEMTLRFADIELLPGTSAAMCPE